MPVVETQTAICPSCGAPMDSALLDSESTCLVCLLRLGLNRAERRAHDDSLGSDVPGHIGPYVIARREDGSPWQLGRGAMGITFRASDESLQRLVALKIINTNLGSRSAEARERFTREARAAAALRHPNVATVYQFGVREETGQFFYAMELVEGETLEERVRRLGPLDVLTTVDIALQVTAALEAAEQRGLVHRDLKPGNLMLVSHENTLVAIPQEREAVRRARRARPTNSCMAVKVIDFGVAKAVAEKTNAMALTHGGFVGTPAFASPEQFTNAPVDVRSDIYSLGATLWFALTGHMLFHGRTVEELRATRESKPLPIEQLKAAHVPRRLISLLMSMLAIEPAARPAGARELATKLQGIRASITGRPKNWRRFAVAAAVVALATIVAFRVFHSSPSKTTPSAIPEKSIAVLPFENLSRDPDNAYFAEGIQEEILTRLSKIGDLKVISRTSTQRYLSKPGNLAEIAKQLGVANIVEGSVQKAADQVRVNVQLINAQTDSHLWAEAYDRKLTDILGVETEVAKGVAESLEAKLTSREKQALAAKATNNPEAYDAYLRGLAFEARSSPSELAEAAGFYERAVQLDPNFALSWARLARTDASLYFVRNDIYADRRDAVKRALGNAQRLEPNSPETLLALGYYQFWVLRDDGLAKTTFGRVGEVLPSSSEAPIALALIARREGHWDQSVAYYEQALGLDPRNVSLLLRAAVPFTEVRQFSAALKLYDRVLDITPNDPDAMALKARIYQAQGNLQQAGGLLFGINEASPAVGFDTKISQLRLERNYGEAVRLLQARLAQFHYDSDYDRGEDQVELALMQRLAGDTSGARVTAGKTDNRLEQLSRDQPDIAFIAASLSQACALMGQKDSALKLAERAIMLLRHAKDPVSGPACEENLALIQTIFAENSRAISILTQLLQTPYNSWRYWNPVTPALLRLDPIWDPLRSDPAFQKLCQEK